MLGRAGSKCPSKIRTLLESVPSMDLRAVFGSNSNSCLGQRPNPLNPCRKNESYSNAYIYFFVGIDISKEKLEVYFQSKSFELLNRPAPLAKFMHQLLELEAPVQIQLPQQLGAMPSRLASGRSFRGSQNTRRYCRAGFLEQTAVRTKCRVAWQRGACVPISL